MIKKLKEMLGILKDPKTGDREAVTLLVALIIRLENIKYEEIKEDEKST